MTTDPSASTTSGFRLLKVQAIQQHYEFLDPDQLEDGTVENRTTGFSWDWVPLSGREFQVMITVTVRGNKSAPEEARVALVGIFAFGDSPTSLKVLDFARLNAVAILFPYAREIIASLTARGHGAFHLPAMNIHRLLAPFPLEESTGFQWLLSNSDVGVLYGVEGAPAIAAESGQADRQ